jgi:hypothetical protein
MKNVSRSIAIVFAAMLMVWSCKKDNSVALPPLEEAVAVQFGSNLGSLVPLIKSSGLKPLAVGSTWEGNDAIGVFMVDNGATNVRNAEANKKYVTAAGATGNFTPDAGNTVYYPINGDKVDFIAYYPYTSSITSLGAYSVNVSNQSNLAAINLLYAKATNSGNGYNKTNATPVALSFNHQLSKLTLNIAQPISSTQITAADLTSMTVRIDGLNTEASFNLATGTLGAASNVKTITPFTETAGAKYEAILLPGSFSGVSVTFTITAGSNPGVYVWNVPNGAFEAGKEYVYNIAFTGTSGNISVTGIINAWDVISSEITLTAPADNASVNAYVATFPVAFTWAKVPTVTAYTLKLSPTGDFTTAGAFVAFDAGDNNSYNLDKATCEGLLAQIAAAAGGAYTGKVAFQWTVEPSAGQPTNIATQTRTLVAIGSESAFPYELNADGANGDGWTVTASCASNGANVPGNIVQDDGYWESSATMGDLSYSVTLTIDMQKVKTVSKIEGQIRFAVYGTTVAVKKNEADDWTTAGPLNFAHANSDKKDLLLDNPVEARYIRIWITSAWPGEEWNFWLSFARVWVYGSNNGE